MLQCKECKKCLSSLEDHFRHNELSHKVTHFAPFTCGYGACIAKVATLSRYCAHFNDFHSDSIVHASVPNEVKSPNLLYQCAEPGCNYKAKSQVTIRTHRFWSHPKNKIALSRSADDNVMSGASAGGLLQKDEFVQNSCPINSDFPSDIVEHYTSLSSASENDVLLKKFVHLGLTLTSKYHVPDSTLEFVIRSYDHLLHENAKISAGLLQQELESLGHGADVIGPIADKVIFGNGMMKMHGAKGPMRSFHRRKKQYETLFPFVPPVSHNLGPNDKNVNCKFHTVTFTESIQSLFECDSVYQQYLDTQRKSVLLSDDLTDFHSGTVFKDHPIFSQDQSALQIIWYADDVEMGNTLGPAGGTYKLFHMSYTLGNLYPWNRAKVDPLQLVLLCKEKDVAYFGLPKVLKPSLDELKELAEKGVDIRGKMIKAGVLVLLGDNLGTHTVCGFVENFSTSKYFCRYCEESRQEWRRRWYGDRSQQINEEDVVSDSSDSESSDDDSNSSEEENSEDKEEDDSDDGDDDVPLSEFIPLAQVQRQMYRNKAPVRTRESYNKCVQELKNNPDGVRGVVGNSPLNDLKYFHVTEGTPPCLPHDLFEGIVVFDLMLCIKKLKTTYKFSYDYLNRKISSFPFKGIEKLDKPPPKFHARRKKVKGTAIQNWVLLRFFPLIIGEKVTNKSDPVWKLILTLIEIVALVCSPVVSKSVLNYLETLIFNYIHMRVKLFPKVPIRCKHKFLEHYPMLTLKYGPLIRSSTLRFEGKHKFFRSEFRAKKCMKNVTKTLSRAHQYMQSSLKVNAIFETTPVVQDPKPFDALKEVPAVMNFILTSFGEEYARKLLYSGSMTFHGTFYENGAIIVTSTNDHPHLACCKINLLVSDSVTVFAIGSKCVGTLLPEMQVYELEEMNVMTLVDLSTLRDYFPYPAYSHNFKSVIVLKHLYLRK